MPKCGDLTMLKNKFWHMFDARFVNLKHLRLKDSNLKKKKNKEKIELLKMIGRGTWLVCWKKKEGLSN